MRIRPLVAAVLFASVAVLSQAGAATPSPPVAADVVSRRVGAAAAAAGIAVTARAPTASDPVSVLVAAAAEADALRRSALAGMTPARWRAAANGAEAAVGLLRFTDGEPQLDRTRWATVRAGLRAMRVDHAALWQATATLAAGVDRAASMIGATPLRSARIETSFGPIVVDASTDGTSCDDVYEQPVFVVIDTCGDDTYGPAAAGADGLSAVPIVVIIDTDGNDVAYTAEEETHIPAMGAATNGGLAIALDVVGSDRRTGPSGNESGGLISGAGRLAGYGVLVDVAGHDEYRTSGFAEPAKNGAGFFNGVGLLVDDAGDDTYTGDTFQQGSGWFGGAFGMLVDADGRDTYDDISTYSQGSGGVGGTGILLDVQGRDEYEAHSHIEQGAGECGGVGALIDLDGDDVYLEPGGRSQGYAGSVICVDEFGRGASDHLLDLVPEEARDQIPGQVRDAIAAPGGPGLGLLLDAGGDDSYEGSSLVQGAHAGAGIGLLVDVTGDDTYAAESCAQGYGNADAGREDGCSGSVLSTVSFPGTAILVDGRGRDAYALDGAGGQGLGVGGSSVLLLDGDGNDFYTGGVVDGGGVQPRGDSGLAIDLVGDPADHDGRAYERGYDAGFETCYAEAYERGYGDGADDVAAGNPNAEPDHGGGYDPEGSGTYEDGYAAGCSDGEQAGYADGYQDGYGDSPYASGYDAGYDECWNEGFEAGYAEGAADADAGTPPDDPDPGDGYDPSGSGTYDDGYADGCEDGYGSGYADGYWSGYDDGS